MQKFEQKRQPKVLLEMKGSAQLKCLSNIAMNSEQVRHEDEVNEIWFDR